MKVSAYRGKSPRKPQLFTPALFRGQKSPYGVEAKESGGITQK
jgi:hypothetical protein